MRIKLLPTRDKVAGLDAENVGKLIRIKSRGWKTCSAEAWIRLLEAAGSRETLFVLEREAITDAWHCERVHTRNVVCLLLILSCSVYTKTIERNKKLLS